MVGSSYRPGVTLVICASLRWHLAAANINARTKWLAAGFKRWRKFELLSIFSEKAFNLCFNPFLIHKF
jgi:hypothetical protein